MRRNKVVIDTNVFVNGWFFPTYHPDCKKIMDKVDGREFDLLFGQETIGELIYIIKNFARHHIDDEDEKVSLMHNISELFLRSRSVNTLESDKTFVCEDPHDNKFLDCAYCGDADFLVTQDRNSGMLDVELDITNIVTASEFISLLEE